MQSIISNNLNPFVIIISLCSRSLLSLQVMPIEIEFTKHRYMDQRLVTANSLWDDIVLWELQEQKCQQRVCQYSNVVQNSQAG